MVYVVIPCFPFSFYSSYIILLRIVLLIPKVSHGKTGVADYYHINIITTKTYRLVIFHYLGERRKRPGGCVIVWNLEPLASGGQSGPKLFPHVICQFLSAWEKNSEQDLFCRGSSANLPRLHTCENKVPFWDFSQICRHNELLYIVLMNGSANVAS